MAKNRQAFNVTPEDFNETRVSKGGMEIAPEPVKEIKSKHVHMMMYEDLVRRADAAAKRQKLSRSELFEKVMLEYLDRNGV